MARDYTCSVDMKAPMGAALVAAATMMAAVSLDATAVRANDLVVRYDQSQLLRLPRPVSEIIIGNPSIADVAIQGGNLLVVTGKTFGITNVIALDAERNVIQDQRVIVERDDKRLVNLNRGGLRQTYSCTPNCSPTLVIGDDPAFFEQVIKNAAGKLKFSESGTESSGGAQAAQ